VSLSPTQHFKIAPDDKGIIKDSFQVTGVINALLFNARSKTGNRTFNTSTKVPPKPAPSTRAKKYRYLYSSIL
jgi:hypothetical protein